LIGRYYDPQTGQFLSVDPQVRHTSEAFVYGGDDPVNRTDPSGMFNVGFASRDSGGAFCLLGQNPNGSCRGATLWRDVVDIPQDLSYLQYWGSYEAIAVVRKGGSHFGPAGRAAALVLSSPLVPFEAGGLGGQALGSLAKGQSIWLQGVPNQPLLGNEVLGPFSGKKISHDLGLPQMDFPGFDYYTDKIQFQW
jgi:hypothetical protein